jgi:hypothetical protein
MLIKAGTNDEHPTLVAIKVFTTSDSREFRSLGRKLTVDRATCST